jgi:hypothetical protein
MRGSLSVSHRNANVSSAHMMKAAAKSGAGADADDWRVRKLHDWLFLLLRFAISRDSKDAAAASGMAELLDSFGTHWKSSKPGFFLRTTIQICEAIPASDSQKRTELLERHIRWIEDEPMRRAFMAVVGFKPRIELSEKPRRRKKRDQSNLWKGLPTRKH